MKILAIVDFTPPSANVLVGLTNSQVTQLNNNICNTEEHDDDDDDDEEYEYEDPITVTCFPVIEDEEEYDLYADLFDEEDEEEDQQQHVSCTCIPQ